MRPAIGICLIATGVLTVAGFLIHPHGYHHDVQLMWWLGHALIFAGLVANLIGLAWLFGLHRAQLGAVGAIGFAAVAIGLAHYIGKLYWSGLLYPLVVAAHPSFIADAGLGPGAAPVAGAVLVVFNGGAIVFAAGFACFGAALWRVGRYPKPPIAMITIGAVLVGLWPLMPDVLQMLSPLVSAIYAGGMVTLGWHLMQSTDAI